MSYEKKAMTAFAQQALAVSDLVGMKFRSTRLGGAVQRIVKVQAPNVESTGGGKQARDSIVLASEAGDSQSNIVCGFIDVKLRAAELRSYAALSSMHRARFKTALDLSQDDYEGFLVEAKQFLESEGFVVDLADDAPRPTAREGEAPAPTGGGSTGLYIGLGVVALAAAGAAAVFLLK